MMILAERKIELDVMTVVITVEKTGASRFEVDVKENDISIDNEDGIFDNLDEAMADFNRWIEVYQAN